MPRLELSLLKPGVPSVRLQFESDVITMGRSSECSIPIDDRYLSRKHAEIVSGSDGWVLHDNGSANGTYVNGTRIATPTALAAGDRIQLGDVQLVVVAGPPSSGVVQRAEEPEPMTQFFLTESQVTESADHSRIIHRLALELIADRSLTELFDFILDRVVDVMRPSRAALALLTNDGEAVEIVKVRRANNDSRELTISRTLLREVVRNRKVLAFTDIGSNEVIAAAASIVGQSIYSALCAPLIAGDTVLGVLYVDFQLSRRIITEDDAQMAAQIARVAAIKLESTRLRESAIEKERLEEALQLAQGIQMRMLPQLFPPLTAESKFDIAADIRPARQVGGDFYDFVSTRDGRLYFCVGDVSGKGIPAALMMAVSRALFRSFILAGSEPAMIMSSVNRQLCEETDESMFVTAFCGVLDFATGEVRYTNAGHNPPLVVSADGEVRPLPSVPGLVLGYLPQFSYVEQSITLAPEDLIFLYTDGVSEATNSDEEMYSSERLEKVLRENATMPARSVIDATLASVATFVGNAPQSDDLTLLCFRYLRNSSVSPR